MKEKSDAGKFKQSLGELEDALCFIDKAKDKRIYFSGISKSFEVCLEYAWKYLKKRAIDEGFEAYSPKESIKIAGKMGLIDDVEKWLECLADRNLAVHDYIGIEDEDYLETIQKFLVEAKRLSVKI